MWRLICIGLAIGASLQAWRQWPANGPETRSAAMVIFGLAMVCAYLWGRGSRDWRPVVNTANASAAAVATSTSSVQVVNVLGGLQASGGRHRGTEALDNLPWMAGPKALSVDALDGQDDLSDLWESDLAAETQDRQP